MTALAMPLMVNGGIGIVGLLIIILIVVLIVKLI